MPIAVSEPSRVDTVAVIKAMLMVFTKASVKEWCVPEIKKFLYSWSEKPVQFPITFDSVKEKMTMIMIGE